MWPSHARRPGVLLFVYRFCFSTIFISLFDCSLLCSLSLSRYLFMKDRIVNTNTSKRGERCEHLLVLFCKRAVRLVDELRNGYNLVLECNGHTQDRFCHVSRALVNVLVELWVCIGVRDVQDLTCGRHVACLSG